MMLPGRIRIIRIRIIRIIRDAAANVQGVRHAIPPRSMMVGVGGGVNIDVVGHGIGHGHAAIVDSVVAGTCIPLTTTTTIIRYQCW